MRRAVGLGSLPWRLWGGCLDGAHRVRGVRSPGRVALPGELCPWLAVVLVRRSLVEAIGQTDRALASGRLALSDELDGRSIIHWIHRRCIGVVGHARWEQRDRASVVSVILRPLGAPALERVELGGYFWRGRRRRVLGALGGEHRQASTLIEDPLPSSPQESDEDERRATQQRYRELFQRQPSLPGRDRTDDCVRRFLGHRCRSWCTGPGLLQDAFRFESAIGAGAS